MISSELLECTTFKGFTAVDLPFAFASITLDFHLIAELVVDAKIFDLQKKILKGFQH